MDIGFIHIGMMKTATTYMQNIWLRDDAYCLSHQGSIPYLMELRERVRKGQLSSSVVKQIQTDMSYRSEQKIVISNEGFSTAFMNEKKYQHLVPDFVEFASRSLSEFSKLTSNVLIVVREPISWLRSAFVQSIKQGGNGNFQNFIDEQNSLVKHSLDLESIVERYSRYFSTILILPYEALKKDEAEFWSAISDRFSVPQVSAKINSQVNTSLNDERTFFLSELNGMVQLLIETIQSAGSYRNEHEKNELANRFPNDSKWVFRRFMEHADEEQLKELKGILSREECAKDFFRVDMPDELLSHIEEKFIHFLSGKIDGSILRSYDESVKLASKSFVLAG